MDRGKCDTVELAQDRLKRALFSGDMPDMPQNYREYFNVAFMFRRKYLDIAQRQPETFYESATEDMRVICEAYDNDPFCMGLLLECYDDIVRKVEEGIDAQPKQYRMAL